MTKMTEWMNTQKIKIQLNINYIYNYIYINVKNSTDSARGTLMRKYTIINNCWMNEWIAIHYTSNVQYMTYQNYFRSALGGSTTCVVLVQLSLAGQTQETTIRWSIKNTENLNLSKPAQKVHFRTQTVLHHILRLTGVWGLSHLCSSHVYCGLDHQRDVRANIYQSTWPWMPKMYLTLKPWSLWVTLSAHRTSWMRV